MKSIRYLGKLRFMFAILFAMLFTFTSCEDPEQMEPENDLAVNLTSASMVVGKELTLKPLFQSVNKKYTWSVSDSTVIEIQSVGKDYSAVIKAIGEGSATATIESMDGQESASSSISTTLIRETEVSVPSSITAYTQSTVSITPDFNLVDVPTQNYTWTADSDDIVSLQVDPQTYQVTIQGLQVGTTELTISSEDGEIVGTTTVTVEDENDGVLKILAIGNSFSEDAIEYYLYGLAKAAGKDIVIGNLYIGGAELSQHVENANNNAEAYSYRKINKAGTKTTTENVSIATAIADENWDYISFQQVSQKSGQYETFTETLPALYDYVSQQNTNEYTRYLLHQTWAYAQNSTHSGFVNYDSDQMKMYKAIVDAYNQAKALIPTYEIVPSGTAIQNARTSYLGDNFNRDGYHLNEIGRYTAASTWFEILFNESVVGNSYIPDGFVDVDAEIAQNAAHEAVLNPDMVTELTDYQSAGGSGVIENDVYIDFATSSNSTGWNGMTSFLEGATIPNLKYEDDAFTGIEMMITSRFNGQNTNGERVTDTDFNMPEDVSGNSFFGNSKAVFGGMLIEKGVIKLSGFTDDTAYDFCFFGSRTATDNRETKYTVIGGTTGSASLNAASNTDELACVEGIQPDADGIITIEVTSGDNNDNGSGFFYINAMRISPEE